MIYIKLTADDLAKIYATTVTQPNIYIDWLNIYMPKYGITTPSRVTAFLAQIGHESARLYHTEERASGQAYEHRKSLGNNKPGDGVRYKGRGLIQITGKYNYTKLSEATGIDFLNNPTWLTEPEYAVMSACWFWQVNGLNELADKGNFKLITKRINGGYNGLEDREMLYDKAKRVLCR